MLRLRLLSRHRWAKTGPAPAFALLSSALLSQFVIFECSTPRSTERSSKILEVPLKKALSGFGSRCHSLLSAQRNRAKKKVDEPQSANNYRIPGQERRNQATAKWLQHHQLLSCHEQVLEGREGQVENKTQWHEHDRIRATLRSNDTASAEGYSSLRSRRT